MVSELSPFTKPWIIETALQRETRYGGAYRKVLMDRGFLTEEGAAHIVEHIKRPHLKSEHHFFCPICNHSDTYKIAHGIAFKLMNDEANRQREEGPVNFGMITLRTPREGKNGGMEYRILNDAELEEARELICELTGNSHPFIAYEQIGKTSRTNPFEKMLHSHFHAITPRRGVDKEKVLRGWTRHYEEKGYRFTDSERERVHFSKVAQPVEWESYEEYKKQVAVILTKDVYYGIKPIIMPFNILKGGMNGATVRFYNNRKGDCENRQISYKKLDLMLSLKRPRIVSQPYRREAAQEAEPVPVQRTITDIIQGADMGTVA